MSGEVDINLQAEGEPGVLGEDEEGDVARVAVEHQLHAVHVTE